MTEELRKDPEPGTELGRSPSGVPGSEGASGTPGGARWPRMVRDEAVKPRGLEDEASRPDDEEPPAVEPRDDGEGPVRPPSLCARRRGGRYRKKKDDPPRREHTAEERLLILDTWKRSGLPAGDFAPLVGLSPHTLYGWRRRFEEEGPAGLMVRQKGPGKGSRLPEITRRTILMLKETNPEWGSERIAAMLQRGPALPASPGAVSRVLREAGYVLEETPTRPHPDKPREFERARPNQLWQTDLFTFVLKRQNRRVYLVAFMDDHSRFIAGYGLHATQSAALVIEVFRSAIASYQSPDEVLTDNGAQYITWRGKGAFTRECEKRGIHQIVARPRHPQTLGKIERFWGSLWRECVETAVFLDLGDAQRRIGLFIDHYNFQRPHSALGHLVPADRYFGAAPEILKTLKARVAANSLELARNGMPKAPFYLAGNAGGQSFSVHAEGERVILKRGDGEREEIDLLSPKSQEPVVELPAPLCPTGSPSLGDFEAEHEEVSPPGVSPLDESLERLGELGWEGGEAP
ncbi:MAG TPA: IS481 family transposase [Planctomycetota bacterium]|nr:IS481 family transposase [Planctomycetota bacterium]